MKNKLSTLIIIFKNKEELVFKRVLGFSTENEILTIEYLPMSVFRSYTMKYNMNDIKRIEVHPNEC